MKLLGALYLVFLGVKVLRAGAEPTPRAQAGEGVPRGALFRDGVFVATFNPKTTLFFAAFLPQFIDAGAASPLTQGLVLATLFVAIALCTDTLYVLTASSLKGFLKRQPRWLPFGRYLSAATFICLGVYAALATPRLHDGVLIEIRAAGLIIGGAYGVQHCHGSTEIMTAEDSSSAVRPSVASATNLPCASSSANMPLDLTSSS